MRVPPLRRAAATSINDAEVAATRSARTAVRRKRRRRRVAMTLAAVSVLGVGASAYGYLRLNGNITRLDVSAALGTARPTPTVSGDNAPLNILLIGSDQRVGLDTTAYGRDTVEGGPHSDTNLLVHISGDRSWAMVVSVPRDSMVTSPKDCNDPSSAVADGVIRQWNQNFNQGGPACVIRTLEGNTGVFVNHFAVVNFDGFRDMVDALGGVDVCLPQAVHDPDSQFTLTAGRHHVDGTTALGYVRVRKSIGDGSDLGRIQRQQAFLSSVIQQATSSKMLLRPDRLYSFLDAATRSLTTDADFSTGDMRSLATAVSGIGLSNIKFYTVPTEQYPADHNRVQWTAAADQLWQAISSDTQPGAPVKKPTPSSPSTTTPTLTVSPDQIDVEVVNDSGTPGIAKQATEGLLVQGFKSATAVSGEATPGGAIVHYAEDQLEAARTVAAAFPGAALVVDESAGAKVVVRLGQQAPTVVPVPNRIGTKPVPSASLEAGQSATSGPSATVTGRSADADICA